MIIILYAGVCVCVCMMCTVCVHDTVCMDITV